MTRADGTNAVDGTNVLDPLKVVVPVFSTKAIAQSTKVAGATNRLTVTLASATALAVDAVVTITGLTGAVATAGDGLALTGTGASMFKDVTAGTASKGTWDATADAQKLTLKVKTALVAGTQYVFAFDVTNPAGAQGTAPTVQIAASGSA